MTVLACCRASRNQSGLTMAAKMAISSAPPASRAVTAAVGLQPASINDLAKGPEDPKAKAEPTASNRPSRKWSTVGRGVVVAMVHLRRVMSKISFGRDSIVQRGHQSNAFYP